MKRRIRHGGDLQSGVICRRCNAKAVNLAGGEVRCGKIGAVISSAETSEAVKCSAPRICSTGGVKYLLVVNLGHLVASPKFAEHVTSVSCTLLAVVFQVTVFVPDSSLVPLFMLNGTLALPHTVTEQVNVTS